VVGDRPGSLGPKAVDRIGMQLRKLYADGLDDPLPRSLSRLIEELEQAKPAPVKSAQQPRGH
jgi:hypothetical protein